jgi:hypothetical protein
MKSTNIQIESGSMTQAPNVTTALPRGVAVKAWKRSIVLIG